MEHTIKLLAFDLDGTLMEAGENQVHPMVRDAIRQVVAGGVLVTLATGRSFAFARPVAADLNLTMPLMCHQGGVIQEMDGRILRNLKLAAQTIRPALELARSRNWQVYLEREGYLVLDANAHYDEVLIDIQALPVQRVPDLADVPDANQLGVYLPVGVTEEHVADLQAAFGPAAHAMRTHPQFINAAPAAASKGQALAWLAQRLGVPQSAVMAVGDSDNDVSMVAWAGVGVAMGGARPAVLEAADWVAPSLAEHGAAATLAHFGLLDGQAKK